MCGLVAIIDHSPTKFFQEDFETFWTMLLLNSIRGEHSTGVVGVRKDGKAEYIKVPGHPFNLDKWKDFDEYKKRMVQQYTSVVGHGRFATRGAITSKNAHPFKRGDITLVHNGTLTNFEELKRNYKNGDVFEVDSDVCAQLFNNFAIQETLSKLWGAFAFIWHDQRDNKIRAVRNYERPLWMFKRTDKDKYYLASDPSVFSWIKDKYKMTGTVEEIETNTLYTFDNKTNGEVTKEKVTTNFTQAVSYGGKNYGTNDYYDNWTRDNISNLAKKPNPTPPASKITHQVDKYIKGDVDLSVGQRVIFSPVDYKDHVKNGVVILDAHTVVGNVVRVNGPVEAVGVYMGKMEDIFDADTLSGIIRSIIVLPESAQHLCRVVVHSIKPYTPSSNVIDLPTKDFKKETTVLSDSEASQELILYDKSRMRMDRFNIMTKDGCEFCDATITSVQAPFVLIVGQKAYCPDCTIKQKYTLQ